jgi:hypothetical protein
MGTSVAGSVTHAIPRRVLLGFTATRTLDGMTTSSTNPELRDLTLLIDRYVALWNDPDPDRRRSTIRELWSDDGAHVLEAPLEMRDAARALGFPTMSLEVRGHDALAFRVGRAQHDFVATAGYRFRSRGDGARLGDVVKFRWEMVPSTGGDVAAVGLEVLLINDGRIRTDFQFIEA